MVIDEILDNYKEIEEDFDLEQNDCLKIFNLFSQKHQLEPDLFYTARAFTSLINTIVNKKIEHIYYLLCTEIEMLDFLKTFDGKYLSNIENLLLDNTDIELDLIETLIDDCFNLTFFLTDFLNGLVKKNDYMEQLNNILNECNKKYGGEL